MFEIERISREDEKLEELIRRNRGQTRVKKIP